MAKRGTVTVKEKDMQTLETEIVSTVAAMKKHMDTIIDQLQNVKDYKSDNKDVALKRLNGIQDEFGAVKAKLDSLSTRLQDKAREIKKIEEQG